MEFLARKEYQIHRAANTLTKEQGKDIMAVSSVGRELWVSVKGRPEGTLKTSPYLMARHYLNDAMGDLKPLTAGATLAIFHMYCDESGKKGDHPVVTFSGLCLPFSKLAGFDSEWNELLHQCDIPCLHMAAVSRLSKQYGTKMPRHQTPDERMDALIPFATLCVRGPV